MHDRDNSSGWSGVYPYSYGYRRCVSDGNGFRDVMSYSCTGAPRVLVFSNPNVNWNGYAAGVSYEAESFELCGERPLTEQHGRDGRCLSRRGFDEPLPPAAPSGMTVKSTAYNSVSLGWADNASNETGFKLERSPNGVDYSLRSPHWAPTPGRIRTRSVAAKTTYYYRVRAYNSAGASALFEYGQRHDAGCAAAGRRRVSVECCGDLTALTAPRLFRGLRARRMPPASRCVRETWNSRKRIWGSATTAATVPGVVCSRSRIRPAPASTVTRCGRKMRRRIGLCGAGFGNRDLVQY